MYVHNLPVSPFITLCEYIILAESEKPVANLRLNHLFQI